MQYGCACLLLDGWRPLLGAAVITLVHLIIDILKESIKGRKFTALRFIIDQILHIAATAAVVRLVFPHPGAGYSGYYQPLQSYFQLPGWNGTSDQVVWTTAVGVACLWGGACRPQRPSYQF